jgi:hypothetical protein
LLLAASVALTVVPAAPAWALINRTSNCDVPGPASNQDDDCT